MKRVIIILVLIGVLTLASIQTPSIAQSGDEYVTGLKMLNFEGTSFEPSAYGFEANWTKVGNEFFNYSSYDFSNLIVDGIDVLLLPRTEGLTSSDVANIASWYLTGEKVLWISADSDFSGFYIADDSANPLLEEIGTSLRISSVSVEDSVSNDGAAYRVISNQGGVSSDMTNYVLNGLTEPQLASIHGPATIHYVNQNGEGQDLRNATLGQGSLQNVNIILNASDDAIAFDSDLSATESDFYAYSQIDGNYPMLVSELTNDSMLVLSAEAIFTDYKFMYGIFDENGADAHHGAVIVDRVINYYFLEELNRQQYDTNTIDSPNDTPSNNDTLSEPEDPIDDNKEPDNATNTPDVSLPISVGAVLIGISLPIIMAKLRDD